MLRYLLTLMAMVLALEVTHGASVLNRPVSVPDFNDRIKDEVANELAEILRSAAKTLQPSSGQITSTSPRDLYPAPQTLDYSKIYSPPVTSDKYYMKKSLDEKNKQIRFHQCYFNPISCFRK